MFATDVLVVGAGQCGLALSRELALRGLEHEVFDGRDAPGDVWRDRWDSLRLFTPARFDGLPGLRFPASGSYCPTAREFADYLDDYRAQFAAPLHPRTTVTAITATDGGFAVAFGGAEEPWRARRVVVATGGHTAPRIPSWAAELDPRIAQLHTAQYRRPADLPDGRILVVGCATSGVQLAVELAHAGRAVTIAGTPTAQIPARLLAVAGGAWFAFMHRVLTRSTPIGRKAANRAIGGGGSPAWHRTG